MRLSRLERAAIFDEKRPKLVRTGSKPAKRGDRIALSSKVAILIVDVRRTRKGEWRIEYQVRDERVRLLRSVPPVWTPKAADRGRIDPPTQSEIAHASIHSSYTFSIHGTVPDAGEPVDPADYARLIAENRARHAEHRLAEQREQEARRNFRSVTGRIKQTAVDMARQGQDPVPFMRDIQRVISDHSRAR